MDTNELKKQYDKLIKTSIIFRGQILDRFVSMEMFMDMIIANYFCRNNKKAEELAYVVLATDKIEFSKKKQTLFYIFDKYPTFIEKYSTIKKDIDKLNNDRNFYAHSRVDTSADRVKQFNETTISYMKFEKGKLTYSDITWEENNKLLDDIQQMTTKLIEFNKIIEEPPTQ